MGHDEQSCSVSPWKVSSEDLRHGRLWAGLTGPLSVLSWLFPRPCVSSSVSTSGQLAALPHLQQRNAALMTPVFPPFK